MTSVSLKIPIEIFQPSNQQQAPQTTANNQAPLNNDPNHPNHPERHSRGGHGREGRHRRSRSEDPRRNYPDGEYRRDPRDGYHSGYHEDRGYHSRYPGSSGYDYGPRYPRDSGYFDDHYYDDADYHRPLSYGPRGARPLYRTRSLPQREFPTYESDYYSLNSSDSRYYTNHTGRVRRPYSNLGDYGYDQGINTYFGNDHYTDR